MTPGATEAIYCALTAVVHPGDEVPITLTFEDDSTKEVTAVVRPVAGMTRP